MKANLQLKHNIDALLRARGQTRRELAQWVLQTLDKRADSWISHIFGQKGYHGREFSTKHLDRIASFFGLKVYQLFQPGMSPETERRSGKERRQLPDRRIIGKSKRLPTTPVRAVQVSPEDEAFLEDLHALSYEKYQHVRAWIAVAKYGPRNRTSDTGFPDAPPQEVPPTVAPTGRLKGIQTRKKPPR